MAGYTRQSVADIIANAVIKAAPVNAEFNALRDAFAANSGHKHDNSTGQGGYVPLIADLDGNNKVVVDTANNRISIFVEVSGVPVEQLRIQDGAIVPVTDNDIDLGTSVLEFKNLFIDGIAKVDTLTVDENATVAGTLGVTGLSTLPTVNVDGGTIDGTVIGAATAQAITGTNITATTGFSGTLTGNVTGNLTGNSAGTHTGPVVGDVTGNVTASSGTSTFTDVTINGTLNMNAGTTGTITGLSAPVNTTDATTKTYVDTADALKLNLSGGTMSGAIAMGTNKITGLGAPTVSTDAATKGYVDTSVSALIDSAPGTLDTLNELAAALGDDPNFATTVATSIATKVSKAGDTMTGNLVMGANKVTSTTTPTANDDLTRKGYVDTQDALKLSLTGGTMSGAIAMGTSKITGLGDPTLIQDAATKNYVDTQDALKLSLSGGTMTGGIVMGANKVTSTATPTANDDLTRKGYVDSILGSATSAADSAAAAAVSETNAAISEDNAAISEANAAASFDSFDDRYLGAKSSAPTLDNDGNALLTGALFFNTNLNQMFVWNGSAWQSTEYVSNNVDINGGTIDGTVIGGSTPAAISGTTITGTSFVTTGDMTFGDNDKAIFGAGSDLQIYHDGSASYISDVGTGNLFVQAGNFRLQNAAGTETMILANNDGAVNLYYDNTLKLATASTGIDVTGTVTSDGLTVDGATQIDQLQLDDGYIRFQNATSQTPAGASIYRPSGTADLNIMLGSKNVARFANGGDISFYEDTGTTPKFFWDASAESLGIGTSSPAYTLDTFGPVASRGSGAGNAAFVLQEQGNNPWHLLQFTGGAFSLNYNGTSTASSTIVVDTSGNVGIGTSSPSSALTVQSDSGALFSDAGGSRFIEIVPPQTANSFVGEIGTRSSHPLVFNTVGAERMRIDAIGNVIITNRGTAAAPVIRFSTDASSGIFSPAAGQFGFTSSGTERLRIDASGNVGIGTSSPSAKLNVVSSGTGAETIAEFGNNNIPNGLSIETDGNLEWGFNALNSRSLTFSTNQTERLRIDASGNLLVGKTGVDFNTAGFEALASGKVQITRASAEPLLLNRQTSYGIIIDLRKDGTSVGSIGTRSLSADIFINTTASGRLSVNGNETFGFNATAFFPAADNAYDLGVSALRYDDIYATNATIQTSDRNEKEAIASLTPTEMLVAARLSSSFKNFKWKDAVAEKGAAARMHSGIIAQDVQDAFAAEGLDAGDYAMFISDTWWEAQTDVPAVEAVAEVVDEEGNVVTKVVEAKDAYTRTDTYDTLEEAPEGATERTRLGIRYPELLAFVAAYNDQRFLAIEARLTALEA